MTGWFAYCQNPSRSRPLSAATLAEAEQAAKSATTQAAAALAAIAMCSSRTPTQPLPCHAITHAV